MQSGSLTVSGRNSTRIHLSGRPRKVEVRFCDSKHIIPCNPFQEDILIWEVVVVDESLLSHKRVPHHHHDREYLLCIEWIVSGVREINWIALY